MVALPRLRRLSESLLSLGEYPGETDIRRGKRRIVIGYVVFGSLTRFIGSAVEFSDGLAGVEFPPLARHWSVAVAASSTLRASSLWVSTQRATVRSSDSTRPPQSTAPAGSPSCVPWSPVDSLEPSW